eukprot:PhF_6_TR36301/c1_g1_i5/m.52999/K01768/E4.6.1.1; adenylate cyclase
MPFKIGFAPLLTLFTICMIAASIPMLLGMLDVSQVGQDLGDNLKVEVAHNIKESLQTTLERAEAITRYNAENFRNGLFVIPDRGDPRGVEVDTFMHHFRVTLYSFRVCTTVSMTDWRGNLFGVYNNLDYTWAGKWESYTNATSGQAVLEDYETYPSGDPREGDIKQMLSRTEPYNSSEQVWFTVVNVTDRNDNAWTPMYTMGDQSPVTMLSHSHVAYRPDGSLIGVISIKMALGFINKLLYRSDDTDAFVVDVLMDGGVVIGASEHQVKLLECVNATSVGIGDQRVGGTQIFTKPSRADSAYIRAVDNLVMSEVGSWTSIDTDRSFMTTVNGIQCRVRMEVVKRNKLHWVVVVIPLPSTFERLRSAIELSSIGMGLTLSLIVLLCIGLYIVLTSPIRSLSKDMGNVALMQLDEFDENKSKSFLSEINEMQHHFVVMVKNLMYYRSFMPSSLFAQNNDEQEEEEVDVMSNKDRGRKAEEGASDAGATTSRISGSTSRKGLTSPRRNQAEAKQKKATVIVINVQGFHALLSSMGGTSAISSHTSYIRKVYDVVIQNKGTPDVFVGDRFIATWNMVRTIGGHQRHACQTVFTVMKSCLAVPLQISAGVSSSSVHCGNMGCEGMLKYTFFGTCASLAPILERYHKRYKAPLLVDGNVEEEVHSHFILRKLDHVLLARLSKSSPIKVFELLGPKTAALDEWMYQLQESESDNPHADFNTAVEFYLHGKYDEALGILTKETCTIDEVHTRFVERLKLLLKQSSPNKPASVDEEDEIFK